MLIDTEQGRAGSGSARGLFEGLCGGFAAARIRAPNDLEHRRLLGDLSDWLQVRQLTAGELSMAQVDCFLSDRRSAGAARHKTRKALGPILGYLRGLGLAPAAEAPVEDGPPGKS